VIVALDASAILAVVFGEAGAARVGEVMTGALVSAVNLAEVVARMTDVGYANAEVAHRLSLLGLTVRPFDRDLAMINGFLRADTKARGLSLGDRACLALARREGARVLTADRAWTGLDLGVDIEVIR
jgi:PIN domain nuclease of toxin-antitoxin system